MQVKSRITNSNRAPIGLAICIATLVSLFPTARAQSYLTQVGYTTFSTKLPVELGYFDAATGDLHIEIPLGTWPQRGGHTFTAALVYDSRIWYINNNTWTPTNIPNSWAGWRLVTDPALGGSTTYKTTTGTCECPEPPCHTQEYYHVYSNFTWTDPYGTVHTFPINTAKDPWGCWGDQSSDSEYANDSTGYYMRVTNYTTISSITTPDGTRVYPGFEDSNGNYFSTDSGGNVIDTLGRKPVTTTTNCNGNSSQICFTILNAEGGTSTYTVTTENVTISSAFGQSGVSEWSGADTMWKSISLPDGTSYQFTYDTGGSGTYGELTGITLPTGGTIGYGYKTYIDAFGINNRWLNTRTSAGNTWTYVLMKDTSCVSGYSFCQQTNVIAPNDDEIQYYFDSNTGSNGSWLANQIDFYGGAQYKSITTTWTSTTDYAQQLSVTSRFLDAPSPYPTQTVQYSYVSSAIPLISKISEWNYYPSGSQPSTADRVTNISYYMGHPTTTTVTNGAGTQTVSETSVTYDAYGSNGLTSVTGVVQHDDTNYGIGNTARGNPTQIERCATFSGSNCSTWLPAGMTYDTTGQVTSSSDPAGTPTTMTYSDNFYNDNGANPPSAYTPPGPTNAYLTKITSLLGSETLGYYYSTGQEAFDTDQNGATTYFHFQDLFNRDTSVYVPGGGWTLWQYSTTERDQYVGISTATASSSCGSLCRHNLESVDGLARVTTNALVNDPSGEDTTTTAYDSNGRVLSISNPYRSTSDPTYGLETYTYDGINRAITTTHPDGNSVSTYYGSAAGTHGGITSQLCTSGTYGLGYPSLTVDEAGFKNERWTDGFGRLIEVDEPDANNSLTLNTCYGYDLNDNLVQVVQGSQTRAFSYDAVSREIQATTPEAGTTYFYFTTSGGSICAGDPSKKCRVVDARGVTTTFSYDALDRLTSKTYSDGTPAANFFYDETTVSVGGWTSPTLTYTKGHLTHSCTAPNANSCQSAQTASAYNYDARGRIVNFWQCSPATCGAASIWQMNYTYDFGDDTTSWSNPYGMTLTYGISAAQRIAQITSSLNDATHPGTLATFTYTPFGTISTLANGCAGSSCKNIQETYTYNNRLQPSVVELGTATSPAANACTVYNYYSSVPSPTSCTTPSQSSTGDNGALFGYYYQDSINSNLAHTAAFTYDPIGRLATAVATGASTYNLTFGYDRYGNMACQTNQNTNGPCPNWTFNGNTNQITTSGFTYDLAGNLTADGTYTYQWNAEERLKSVDNGNQSTTIYDATGGRSERTLPGSAIEYVHDRSGLPVGGATGSNVFNAFVWAMGRMIADYEIDGVHFDHVNEINSVTQATDWIGTTEQEQLLYPWGDSWQNVGFSVHQTFGGLADFDSDNGEYQSRYRAYPTRLGRWLSPDPLGGDADDPQTFNRYSYVLNSPCSFTDAVGLRSCVLRLMVNDPHNVLNATEKQTLENRVQQIFQDASSKLGNGDSLSVQFVDNPSWSTATYSIDVSNSSAQSAPGGDLGATYAPINFDSSTLFPNVIPHGANSYYPDDAFGRLLGTVAAHELGHGLGGFSYMFNGQWWLLGLGSSHPATDPNNLNIMMTGHGSGYTWNSTGAWAAQKLSPSNTFSRPQAQSLFNRCLQRGGDNGAIPVTWVLEVCTTNSEGETHCKFY